MVILGFDPGTLKMGWAITSPEHLIDAGLITSKEKVLDFRFLELYKEIVKIFDKAVEHGVTMTIIEQYVSAYSLATDAVKGISGILRLESVKRGIPTDMLYPSTLKKILTGKGNCDKELVEAIVMSRYNIKERYSELDVTDAIAATMVGHRRTEIRMANMDKTIKVIEKEKNDWVTSIQLYQAGIVSDKEEGKLVLMTLSHIYACKIVGARHYFVRPLIPVGEFNELG